MNECHTLKLQKKKEIMFGGIQLRTMDTPNLCKNKDFPHPKGKNGTPNLSQNKGFPTKRRKKLG